MKLKLAILILTIVILVGATFYLKTTLFDSQPTLLTVVGEGKVKASPELAQFTITYLATSSLPTDALEEEKNFRQRIITLLTGLYEVGRADLQVSYPRVLTTNTTGKLTYQAGNTIDVKFKKLSSLDAAISKLYQVGNTNISVDNIVFTTSNPRDLEDQAISEAFKDGMIRAEKMARASGKRLGKLVSVAGQQTQAVGTVTTEAGKIGGFADTTNPALPGQIEITRNITLVYDLRGTF